MKLSHIGILAVRGTKGIAKKLAEALNVTPSAIYRWVRENNDNLTKLSALEVIMKETGLSQEQILEREPA